jgi:hypothetical protein
MRGFLWSCVCRCMCGVCIRAVIAWWVSRNSRGPLRRTHQVTSPRASCSRVRVCSLFTAPRALNDPVACSLSSFRYASQRPEDESHGDGSSGVRWTWGAMRAAAAALAAARSGISAAAAAPVAAILLLC